MWKPPGNPAAVRMTRRVSKHGTTYTEGSQATPDPAWPNVCGICGQRIYTSRESYEHRFVHQSGERLAWHTSCREKKAAA